MSSRRLGLAAASLLGAATLLTAVPVTADELVCPDCVVDRPGAKPVGGIENAFGKVETVLGKWDPESAPFIKIGNALGKIEDVMQKYGG